MIELEPVVQLDLTLTVINIRLSLSGANFGTGDLDFERRVKISAGVDSIKTFRTFFLKVLLRVTIQHRLQLKNGGAICH